MDFNAPVASDNYTAILPTIRAAFADLATWSHSASDNRPVETKQWSAANNRFERWNGSAFVELTSLYNINVSSLNGRNESFLRNASNLNSGTVPTARLPTATTSQSGIVQLSTSTTSSSTTTAATSSAVNAVRNLLSGKSDTGHTHSAGDLPNATTAAQGIVQLSTSSSSSSTTLAATPSAVNSVRLIAEGKANSSHSHSASDLPNASTSAQGVVQLSDSVASTSTTLAATANAVRQAYNLANSHSHSESAITSGTFDIARIPTLDDTRHGNRGGGALHSNANSSTAGFMSPSHYDKVRQSCITQTKYRTTNTSTTSDTYVDLASIHNQITLDGGVGWYSYLLELWVDAGGGGIAVRIGNTGSLGTIMAYATVLKREQNEVIGDYSETGGEILISNNDVNDVTAPTLVRITGLIYKPITANVTVPVEYRRRYPAGTTNVRWAKFEVKSEDN